MTTKKTKALEHELRMYHVAGGHTRAAQAEAALTAAGFRFERVPEGEDGYRAIYYPDGVRLTYDKAGNTVPHDWTPASAPSFDTTPEDAVLIYKIAQRAVAMAAGFGVRWKLLDVSMDVTATHANGCPLRLADLLAADVGNFSHDLGGILKHLDRRTGKLGDCFSPRFAARGGR